MQAASSVTIACSAVRGADLLQTDTAISHACMHSPLLQYCGYICLPITWHAPQHLEGRQPSPAMGGRDDRGAG